MKLCIFIIDLNYVMIDSINIVKLENYLLYRLKIITLFVFTMILGLVACTTSSPIPSPTDNNSTNTEVSVMPPELLAYEQYKQVVDTSRGPATTMTIQATVLQLNLDETCPYPEAECPIAPYPNHGGIIRLDNVTYDEMPAEGASEADGGSSSQTTAPNQGGGAVDDKSLPTVQVGAEVKTHFLLTAQPAVARRVPVTTGDNNLESATVPDDAGAYPPLVQENGRYIFTIATTTDPVAVDIELPGLAINDRFQATVRYDGTIQVITYTLLP